MTDAFAGQEAFAEKGTPDAAGEHGVRGEREALAERAIRWIRATADTWGVPGGVALVADAEGILFEHCFGFADLARSVPVSHDHLFEIGSISKIATAAVVLQLAEEGRLSLADPIASLLPWLTGPLSHPGVTVERLLQHSAGIVSGVDAVPDQLAQAAGYADLAGAPGLSPAEDAAGTAGTAVEDGEDAEDAARPFFHYSNLGFILLGLAASRVSGEPLRSLVAERVLRPLGMADSLPCVTFDDIPRLARGSQALARERPWIPGDALVEAPWLEVDGADGNIATTGRDLVAFARALLRGGRGDGPQLLSVRAFDEMTGRLGPGGEETLRLPGVPRSDPSLYGLGINTETVGGHRVLSHGGGMVGYASFLLVDLDGGLVVAVLTNADGDSPIAEAIARPLLALFGADAPADPAGRPLAALHPRDWGTPSDARDDAHDEDLRPRLAHRGMLGTFVAGGGPHRRVLTVRMSDDGDGVVHLDVELDGERSPLFWTWSDRVLTRHSALRGLPLSFENGAWTWGEAVFRPLVESGASDGAAGDVTPRSPYCGHYRSYSPWFPDFRVLQREASLLLVASPGVEAPAEDMELCELGPGIFRIGADPRLPERLAFGPVIDGAAAWADRDGCRYSRAFTD